MLKSFNLGLVLLTTVSILSSNHANAKISHFNESGIKLVRDGHTFFRTCSYSGSIRSLQDQSIINQIEIFVGHQSKGVPFVEFHDKDISDPLLGNKLKFEYVNDAQSYFSEADNTFKTGNRDIFGKSRVLMKESYDGRSPDSGATVLEFFDVDSVYQASLIGMSYLWKMADFLKPKWASFTKIADGQVTDSGCSEVDLTALDPTKYASQYPR